MCNPDGFLRGPERAIAPVGDVWAHTTERGFASVGWLGHVGDSVMAHGYAPMTSTGVLGNELLVCGADLFLVPEKRMARMHHHRGIGRQMDFIWPHGLA